MNSEDSVETIQDVMDQEPNYEAIEKALMNRVEGETIIIDKRTMKVVPESGEKVKNLTQEELYGKLLGQPATDTNKEDILRIYDENKKALAERNKQIAKQRQAKIEIDKVIQKEKEDSRRKQRDEKVAVREKLNEERRQHRNTAVTLEDCMSETLRQYEEAVTQRNLVRQDVTKLEVKAKDAAEEAESALEAFERARRKYEDAEDERLRRDKLVMLAKSPKLDENISSLRGKLQSEFNQTRDAWEHVNPKKRRKELQNNALRKMVRDVLK